MDERMLEKTYSDPSFPGSYGGIDSVYRSMGGKISKRKIEEWLRSKRAYTLHKPARRNFIRNRVIVGGIDEQWQADLVDMGNLSEANDGYRYLLTCIDIFSKYAWVLPIKQKLGVKVIESFESIFQDRKPQKLQTDQGSEFTNKKFQMFLKSQEVEFFTTSNETKASVVERFNRSFKTKMFKYFTDQNSHRFLDVLDKLVHSYNHTYHRSIKMQPIEVNSENEKQVWSNLYGNLITKKFASYKFKVGDTVRVAKTKLKFEKSYESNWSEELFTVSLCIPRNPPVYKIKDLMGEDIKGTFYSQELQRVEGKDEFPVEKVLKKRRRKRTVEYFVKFKGYPEKFNAWIPASSMISL